MAELENSAERRGEEDDSEEDSNTDEDEVIPDIGKDGAGGALPALRWRGEEGAEGPSSSPPP